MLAYLAAAAVAATPLTGANLISNPGAEASPGGTSNHDHNPPAAWRASGGFTVVRYGTPFVPTEVAHAIDGGANFFGGSGTPVAGLRQTIRLTSAQRRAIDRRLARATLSGYLGGYQDQADKITVTARFVNSRGKTLRRLTLGPVAPQERGSETTLVHRAKAGAVPRGSRRVIMTVRAVRSVPECNDGYADNLALRLTRR